MTVDVRWLSVFADVPTGWFDRSVRFWAAVAGSAAGEPAGDAGEFRPLRPARGDGYLWLQRVERDTGGWHLDLHVPDLEAAAREAEQLGARPVRNARPLAVYESPAGQPFCLYEDGRPARQRPNPPTWPGVGRSLGDQLCLDVPFDAHESECAFWAALTGWPVNPAGSPEFTRINPPGTLPVQLLIQRLGRDDGGGARAHLDMSADEPAAEAARHVRLGAQMVAEFPGWTTLRAPAGLRYCVTHRRPYEPAR
jgi:hypothetical protein